MKNMKTAAKLMVSFAIVIILAGIVGGVGIFGMSSINAADDELYQYNVVAISAMGDIRENMQMVRVGMRNFALYAQDEANLKAQKAEIDTLASNMNTLFVNYEKTITDESLETAYYSAKKIFLESYMPTVQQVYEASFQSADEARAIILSDNVAKLTNDMANAFTLSSTNNDQWASDTVNDNTKLFEQMTFIELGVLLVAVIIAVFLAFYLSRLISRPLVTMTEFMKKAASTGDITLSPEDIENIGRYAKNRDETGMCLASTAGFIQHVSTIADELGSVSGGDLAVHIQVLSESDVMGMAMLKTVDNLNDMFGEINASAAQVSIGSKQIADGAQSLAQGSTEQAASVEELAASIGEIAEKTKTNADMASRAANLGNAIKGNAEKGNVQMEQMVQAVREINEASGQISKVIKVIDDIAFQTNILALNAAVEAARAGQHGKGFAVVAEEVRNLAAKSAEAAKDTGTLIANSMEKAELGARIAEETAASLADIVSGINESSQIVGDISRSSEEQAAAITQIDKGIDQVAQVVQRNSATAEESAAASQEMSGQANMLEQLLTRFKLRSGRSSTSAPGADNKSYFESF